MFDFSSTQIKRIAAQYVGNASREEGIKFSADEMRIDNEMVRDLLLKHFLSPFRDKTQLFRFTHDIMLGFNDVYSLVANIPTQLGDAYDFHDFSCKLASKLYSVSNHPKIKAGEFHVVQFTDIVIEDELLDAIGIFKSEHKDTYLKTDEYSVDFKISYENGVDINKLDKGCLIFQTEKEKGFVVAIVDGANDADALYWKKAFLNVMPRQDVALYTNNYMELCAEFIAKHYDDDVPKQVSIGKQVADYFDSKDEFDATELGVLIGYDKQELFETHKKAYEESTNINLPEAFEIEPTAAKKAKKYFKSKIKLDNNFFINVLKDTENLVRGFDEERNMKYYQLFYEEEI